MRKAFRLHLVRRHAAALIPLLQLAGCGASCGTPPEGDKKAAEPPGLPTGLHAGWNEFKPGGDTLCARGGEYAFWVRPGTVNKVLIEFSGGGACWNEATCSVAGSVFQDSVEGTRQAVAANYSAGIYDHGRAENPFASFYHVIVPYCTGDLHWGHSVTTYRKGTPDEMTIHHQGAVDARAVLRWVYASFSQPEQVFVTGCSAGAYGAALWSADVMARYPRSRVYQLGDSGAGVITEQFFRESFPSWNAEEAFPKDIPELDPARADVRSLAMPDLYAGIANHYPTQWMSEYNTMRDHEQVFYFKLMGGSGAPEWSQKMLSSIDQIEARARSFRSFIAPGEQHCILLYDNFYTVRAEGVKLVDWLRDELSGKAVRSVRCRGAECDGPTP